MKKKLMALLLGISMVAGLMAGCGNSADKEADADKPAANENAATDNNDAADSPEAGDDAGDVTIWYYWETEGHQVALDAVIAAYNEQSDSKVTAKYVPFADFKKQLSIGASADELPDMVIIDAPDHASYASMGIFADLTGRVDVGNYFDGPVASCTLDDTLYGIPFGSNCLSLYYNTDLMEAAGQSVPTTWDELKTTAAALTQDDVTGLAFCSIQNEEGTFNFMPWVWSTGAGSFEIEKAESALALVKDLVDEGSMSKEVINWTQGDVMNQFISGNVAMMVNGPWQVPTIRSEAADLNWDVALIPKDSEYASVLGGENYAVIDGGNEEGALAFLEYATNDENVAQLMEAFGYIAAKSNVAAGQYDDDEIMSKFVAQMDYAQPRGPHADWPDISDAISLAFNEVITGASEPAEAAAKAQNTIDSIVK